MAGLDELLGQVVADLAAADDQDEHAQASIDEPGVAGVGPGTVRRHDVAAIRA